MDYELLRDKLNKGLPPARIILSSAVVLTEGSRESPEFTDPKNLPFFYHLGGMISPRSVVQVGSYLGLTAHCFLQKCKSVERFLVVEECEEVVFAKQLIVKNLRKFMPKDGHYAATCGNRQQLLAMLNLVECDLAILTGKYDNLQEYMGMLWEGLALEGFLVVNYIRAAKPTEEAFSEFCKVKGREPQYFDTRYGIGLVQK